MLSLSLEQTGKGTGSMSKRIGNLKEELKKAINSGAPGFRESLPSLRELIPLYGESHHVVNTALKELEREGLIKCIPYKGYKVVGSEEQNSRKTEKNSFINVLVVEDLIWQIDFWCECFKLFEKKHPGWKIKPHFISNTDTAIQFLNREMGTESTVIIHARSQFRAHCTMVPRPEIERVSGRKLPVGDLLKGLLDPLDAFTFPYQIQAPLLFCRKKKNMTPYDWKKGYSAFLDWVRENYSREQLAPFNTQLFLSGMGCEKLELMPRESIRKKLSQLLKFLQKISRSKLINLNLPPGLTSDLKQLHAGKLGCTVRGSYCAGAVDYPWSSDAIAIYPPPLEPDGKIPQPVSSLAIAGTHCTGESAEFFHFLLDREVQDRSMRACLGFSPLESCLDHALEHAAEYPFDIAGIIQYVKQESIRAPLLSSGIYGHDFITKILTDRLVLPLLTDSCPDAGAHRILDELEEELMQYAGKNNTDARHNALRRHFLGVL